MADLQELEPLLLQLFATYNLARNEADAAEIHLASTQWYPNTLALLYSGFPKLCMCLDDLIDAVNALICTDVGQYMDWFCNVDCFRRVQADSGELTSAAIRAAWIDGDITERMSTVLTLDEMRREVWQEEFYSFRIKPAGRT